MVEDMLKKRMDAKLDKGIILWSGLLNYGEYGTKNPFNDVLSNEELKGVKATDLTTLVTSLSQFRHKIFYYGQNELKDAVTILDKEHFVSDSPKEYPKAIKHPELAVTETQVYFCNYNMKQAEIVMLSWDELYNKNLVPSIFMFNEYYGGNMSSVLFQEIREKQALAYSVFGNVGTPTHKDEHHSVFAYVGTQADKMKTAVTEVSKLLNVLPDAQKQFDLSKESLIKTLESDWITRDAIYWAYQRAEKRGLDYDIRKDIYEQIKTMQLKDVHQFFDTHVKGKKYIYLVLGNRADIDMKALQALGTVKELNLQELYGY